MNSARQRVAAQAAILGRAPTDVCLWTIAAPRPVPPERLEACRALLSEAELARAARFLRAADADRHALFRASVRCILAGCLGVDPAGLPLGEGPRGKPVLAAANGAEPALHFNLSHTGDLGVLAVTRAGPLGVDIERLDALPDADRLARRILSPAEHAAYAALASEDRQMALLRAWTRKEAVLKAIGGGLDRPPAEVEVTLAPDAAPRLLGVAGARDEAGRWALAEFRPAPGVLGALAHGDGTAGLHFASDPFETGG